MRDLRLQAIDYKLKRIRFYKTIGKVVFLMAIITILALIFINLNYVLKTQADTLNQIVDLRHDVDEVKESIEKLEKDAVTGDLTPNTTYEELDMVYMGEYTITHYCPESCCCGKWANGYTATGTKATEGRTIAVDPDIIPYGTTVIIDDHEYIAEDCGGAIKGNRIDVYVDSHSEAIQRGVIEKEVYIWLRQ